jgi:hypothetical protein
VFKNCNDSFDSPVKLVPQLNIDLLYSSPIHDDEENLTQLPSCEVQETEFDEFRCQIGKIVLEDSNRRKIRFQTAQREINM